MSRCWLGNNPWVTTNLTTSRRSFVSIFGTGRVTTNEGSPSLAIVKVGVSGREALIEITKSCPVRISRSIKRSRRSHKATLRA